MNNDFLASLSHSWGTKPEQKRREKEYNAKYYQEHKEKWKKVASDISDPYYRGQIDAEEKWLTDDKSTAPLYRRADLQRKIATSYKPEYAPDDDVVQINEGLPNARVYAAERRADLYRLKKTREDLAEMTKTDENGYNRRAAMRRQTAAAKNERDKAIANANKAAEAYDDRLNNPGKYKKQEAKRKVKQTANNFVSNWKSGAQTITNSVEKGRDFVKNLFK